jgi:ElaB/YqjD/DUF883 family membrane-anchored ribosome-binding protein
MADTLDFLNAGQGVKKIGEVVAEGMREQVRKDIRSGLDAAENWLTEQPVTAVLAAFGLGLFLSTILWRR